MTYELRRSEEILLQISDSWVTPAEVSRVLRHSESKSYVNTCLRSAVDSGLADRRRRGEDGPWEYRAKRSAVDSIRQKMSTTIDPSLSRA